MVRREVAPQLALPFDVRRITLDGAGEGSSGRRSKALGSRGRSIRPSSEGYGIHVPGTVLAAAERGATISDGMIDLAAADIRGSIRQGTESNLIVFLVDTSGSMAARDRLSAVTGAVGSLLRDAYQKRDKVAVVTFRGTSAEVVLPPTKSVNIAMRRLDGLSTGGRTPLAQGLATAKELIDRERLREPSRRALLVVLSDGRATGTEGLARAKRVADSLRHQHVAGSVVIDCEKGRVRLGLAAQLAENLGATCMRIDELNADAVSGVVRAYDRGYGTRKA